MRYFITKSFELDGKFFREGRVVEGKFSGEALSNLVLIDEEISRPRPVITKSLFDWQGISLPDIVIPHHNRQDLLRKCLESIPMYLRFRVFVIRGFTFAKACNMGVSISKAGRIIFINDDAIVNERALWELCRRKEDIVGVPLYIPDLGKTIYGMTMYWDKGRIKTRLEFDRFRCHLPTGAMFMIKRRIFNALGGFYEGYRNGGEDNELNLLAIEKGCSFGRIDTSCEHFHSSSKGRHAFDSENHALLARRFPKKRFKEILAKLKDCYPLISVIIPTRNKGVPRSMKSLKAQTYPNIEIIVSRDLKRRGANWARNRGRKRARGKYLYFLDDDIELEPECLELMEEKLRYSNASYVYANYKRIGYEWRGVKEGTYFTIPFDLEKLKQKNYVSTMSLINARDFPGFDEKIERFQDWDLWLTMAERGKYGEHIDKILFTAYYNRNGISINVKTYNKGFEVIKKKHNL